jgi:vacuolar-type H+-ATPase subunit H
MAKQDQERDWSEIMSEVRTKAKSEIDELVEEMKPKVQQLVKKVRDANFHDEAEELLTKLRQMANEFSHNEDGPSKSKTKNQSAKRQETVSYLDDDGKPWKRAKNGWTDAQKKKYKANLKNHTM